MSRLCANPYPLALACLCILLLIGQALPGVAQGAERVLEIREGDILMAPASAATPVAMRPTQRSVAVPDSRGLWPDGIVPYRIDPALSEQSVRVINEAIDHWNRVSAITLQPARNSDVDLVLFQPGSGCASWVGRQGGVQEIWASPSCTAGSMKHEIGHALGLEHEHTRPDRDQFITIHWENIDPQKHHNFDVAPRGSRMVGDYDYASIMHYGAGNFSLDGGPTITAINQFDGFLGQRVAASAGDIASIARLYRSDLSLVTRLASNTTVVDTTGTDTTSTDVTSTEIEIFVSNTQEQGAHAIEVVVRSSGHALLDYSGDGWTCRFTEAEIASCDLARLPGSAQSILRLTVAGALTPPSLLAEVSSKTPDNNPSNNGSGPGFIPALAAASFEDDPIVTTGLGGGAFRPVVSGLLLGLLLLRLFYRQTRGRIDRQTCDRVKHLPIRSIGRSVGQ